MGSQPRRAPETSKYAKRLVWAARGECGCILAICVADDARAVLDFLREAHYSETLQTPELLSLAAVKRDPTFLKCEHERPRFEVEKWDGGLRFVLGTKAKPSAYTLGAFYLWMQRTWGQICEAAGIQETVLTIDPAKLAALPDDGRNDLYCPVPVAGLSALGRSRGRGEERV